MSSVSQDFRYKTRMLSEDEPQPWHTLPLIASEFQTWYNEEKKQERGDSASLSSQSIKDYYILYSRAERFAF